MASRKTESNRRGKPLRATGRRPSFHLQSRTFYWPRARQPRSPRPETIGRHGRRREPGFETKPHGAARRFPRVCPRLLLVPWNSSSIKSVSSPRSWVARPSAHQIRPLASAAATCLDRRTCPFAAGGGVQLVSQPHSWLAIGGAQAGIVANKRADRDVVQIMRSWQAPRGISFWTASLKMHF
jgi:hypothetical protein